MELNKNEIVVSAHAVKYHHIDYSDNYVTITQNRTRRRVYDGWYFEDTGRYIYVSEYCAHIFQHKRKVRRFIVDTVTKEWRDYQSVVVERHKPETKQPVTSNEIKELKNETI